MKIETLKDLNFYRSAPDLTTAQSQILIRELNYEIINSDWITIGIMASSDYEAKEALETLVNKYSINTFNDFNNLQAVGNVFLKGNQKSGEVYIRSENGLGKGILLTCQYDDLSKQSMTYGPFPLNFFGN